MSKVLIIVAAGRGNRFSSNIPKQYHKLEGHKTILRRVYDAFCNMKLFERIVCVINSDDIKLFLSSMPDNVEHCYGGDTRQKSVLNGLEYIDISGGANYVLIHDAVRPFFSKDMIISLLDNLKDNDGAILASNSTDTVKICNDNDIIVKTLDRDKIWFAQTPQGFKFNDILKAHRVFTNDNFTDDSAIAEEFGLKVKVLRSDKSNLKITFKEDLKNTILRDNNKIRDNNMIEEYEYRVGNGFDVHNFCEGDHVYLCGIKVPHNKSLEGHSDADVVLHSINDAIYGALGLGDIGKYFPPSDDNWKGCDSSVFLEHAKDKLIEMGAKIVNLDITIICEEPKISKYRDEMIAKIANILNISSNRVNVKATTTEKLGFTGRKEGIACITTVSIKMLSS